MVLCQWSSGGGESGRARQCGPGAGAHSWHPALVGRAVRAGATMWCAALHSRAMLVLRAAQVLLARC